MAIALGTIVLCGVLPALVAARGAPASPLRLDARAGRESVARRRNRGSLVAAQMALAITMLAGAGLLVRTLAKLEHLDLGYRPDGLAVASLTFPVKQFKSDKEFKAYYYPFFERAFARVRTVPGVVSVSPVLIPPFLGPNVWTWKPVLTNEPAGGDASIPLIALEAGGADYFRTMGIPILRGRGILESDREGAASVAVVSEATARQLWPGKDPIGQQFKFPALDITAWRTVVGVVHDIHYRSLRESTPTIFLPWRQAETQGVFAIRTTGDPAAVFPAIRRALHEEDASLDLWQPRTMDEYLGVPMAQPRTTALLLTGFALVALLLAATGLYGALAFTVGERTHDIAVRSALGATPARLRREVLGQALAVSGVGALIGLGIAVASSRALGALLFEVRPVDPVTLLGTSALLLLVALAAAWLPARSAMRIDPARTLRAE